MELREHATASAEKVSFGELLRGKRAAHSPPLTQEGLAQLMDVSRALVNHMERGQRSPTRDFVSNAVSALGLSDSDAALLWEAAGFIPPRAPIAFSALETRGEVEQALPSSDQNPILAYLAHADVLDLIEGWRLLAEADVAIRNGKYEQARDLCEEVATRRSATPALRLFARRKIAEAYRQLGDLVTADEVIAPDTIQTELHDGDNSPSAAFLNALFMAQRGEIALRRGHYQQGLENFAASKKGYSTLLGHSLRETSETSAVIHLGLGMTFERMAKASLFLGNETQAESYCSFAKSHLDKATPSPQRSELQRKVIELRAWALARQDNFENAITLHEQARDAARSAGDTRGFLKNCVYLGDDWRRRAEHVIENLNRDSLGTYHPRPPRAAYADAQKQTDSQIDTWVRNARGSYEKAMRLMKTHPDPYMMGLCLRNLGIISRFQDNFAEADALLDRAERFDSDMKLEGRLPAIHEARGDLYWWQGAPELAVKWYAEALKSLDTLLSTTKESSEMPLSPDEQHEALVHTRERLRVLASLEALLPLPAARAALERWRPDLSDILENQWRDTTSELQRRVITAIRQELGKRMATSDSAPAWIGELADFEEIPGPRILAQNALSAGWSDALPTTSTNQSHAEREPARASDAFQRRRAYIKQYASGYRDLASQEVVLKGLAEAEGRSQIQNALALMEQSHGTYRLTLSRTRLPLAFTVKGGRVLAEVPVALLDTTQLAAAPSQDSQDLAQPTAQPGTTAKHEPLWCYRFDDPDLARDLTALFNRLEEIAVNQGGGDAAAILRQSLSTNPEPVKQVGM